MSVDCVRLAADRLRVAAGLPRRLLADGWSGMLKQINGQRQNRLFRPLMRMVHCKCRTLHTICQRLIRKGSDITQRYVCMLPIIIYIYIYHLSKRDQERHQNTCMLPNCGQDITLYTICQSLIRKDIQIFVCCLIVGRT